MMLTFVVAAFPNEKKRTKDLIHVMQKQKSFFRNDPFYRHTRAKSQPFRNKTKLIQTAAQSPMKPLVAIFDTTDNGEKTAATRLNRITAYNKR